MSLLPMRQSFNIVGIGLVNPKRQRHPAAMRIDDRRRSAARQRHTVAVDAGGAGNGRVTQTEWPTGNPGHPVRCDDIGNDRKAMVV